MGTLQWAYEKMVASHEDPARENDDPNLRKAGSSKTKKAIAKKMDEDELASLFSDLSCNHKDDEMDILDTSIKTEQTAVPAWQKQIDALPRVRSKTA